MKLSITKNTGKPHVIAYTRDDGSVIWMHADDYFVRHDLSHYAIETVMGYRTAFNGMLNNGMDLKDFEDRQKRSQITMTDEAAYAENMANLFLMEIAEGQFADFNAVQQDAFATSFGQHALTSITMEKIQDIRAKLKGLLEAWKGLSVGETLILEFVHK